MLREPVLEPVTGAEDPDALLASAAEAVLQEGAAPVHTSAMVALYPDAATAADVALAGGEKPDDIHLTLAFLGKIANLSREAALRAVRDWAAGCPPLVGEISGVGKFVGGPDPVTYLSVDLPELPHQRQCLVELLDGAGVPPKRDHGYTPHMTLDYASRRPKIEKPIPLRFTHATLSWGDEQIAVPFCGTELKEASLVDHAREELVKAGLFEPDSDYEGMLGNEILRIVQTFSEGGHSGGSAAVTLAALEKLLRWETLTELTSDPKEWLQVQGSVESQFPDMEPLWQSRRQPNAFSKDGGQTWNLLEAAALLEGKWDAAQHPRWPKGTPRAGEFIKVGQRFHSPDGKEWVVSHIAGGKVIANRAEGKYTETETGVFSPTKVSGADSPLKEDTHVIADAVKEAKPKLVKGGKSKESTVAIVDPYVDSSSHDPSIGIPKGAKIGPEEWQRFGKLDQENYAELMERFGNYSPGKAKSLIDESYQDYTAQVQAIVKNAYSAQYGASSGHTLSLTSLFKGFTKPNKNDLAQLDAQRQTAMELQGRHKDVIAWDLYNRTRSPDVAVFHKSNDPTNYWQNYIAGKQPVMSGLSQSFNFGANFGFGNTTLATPLAIRHVLMSSYSAQPIPGQTHFQGELEISVAEQLKIDKRSITFSLHDITANQKKWLMGVTKAPSGGSTIDTFREALKSGEMLPTPPAPADIQMQGSGQKLWIDPPPEAASRALDFSEKLPGQQGQPWNPAQLDKSGPWAFKDAAGRPEPTMAKESELKPGDYMMGLKGTLYLVVEDPGDSSGFGLRYVKIEGGKFTGESYNFEGGGTNQYFKLSAHYELPDPHKEAQASDLFDPHAWVNGNTEKFTGKLAAGDKFKVNGNAYEVKAQLSGAQTQITDLANGKVGTINTDYKTHLLVPKDGYVPEEEASQALQPAKGMTLAYDGTKHTITTILKDGTVKAKPAGGGKTVAISGDDPALGALYDPTAHKIGAKIKAGDLAEGDLFHGGRGSAQRPYVVTGAEGNKVLWRSLDTGEEGVFTKGKIVRQLDDAETPSADQPQNTPGAAFNPNDYVAGAETDLEQAAPGTIVSLNGYPMEVVESGTVMMQVKNLTTGGDEEAPPDMKATILLPKNELGAEAIPHDQLKLNDSTTLGNLQVGDHFEVDGEHFAVLSASSGPESNAFVAPVLPSGSLGSGSSEGSFPDKLVTFKGDAKHPPAPAMDAPSGAGLPHMVDEGGFAPYKSKYGSGGKYTHDKIGDMAVGTVFRGTDGKLWKVKSSDAAVVVSDGNTLYAADPSLRGRVVSDPLYDTTGPVPGPSADPVEVEAGKGLIDNSEGLSLGELPVGSTVLFDGKVYETQNPSVGMGSENQDLVGLSASDGVPSVGHETLVPDKIKMPPKGDNEMKAQLEVEPESPYVPTLETVSSLSQGDEFKTKGKTWTVVAHTADGGSVVQDGEGNMEQVAAGALTQDVGGIPAPDIMGGYKVSDLPKDTVFSTPSGDKKIIAHTYDGGTIVTNSDGGLEPLPNAATVKKEQIKLDAGEAPAASLTAWTPEVEKALAQAGLNMDQVDSVELAGYKSTWGSGAKYKHYRFDELDPGTLATDKAGVTVSVIGPATDGNTLVFAPGSGEILLVPTKTKVKVLPG